MPVGCRLDRRVSGSWRKRSGSRRSGTLFRGRLLAQRFELAYACSPAVMRKETNADRYPAVDPDAFREKVDEALREGRRK